MLKKTLLPKFFLLVAISILISSNLSAIIDPDDIDVWATDGNGIIEAPYRYMESNAYYNVCASASGAIDFEWQVLEDATLYYNFSSYISILTASDFARTEIRVRVNDGSGWSDWKYVWYYSE